MEKNLGYIRVSTSKQSLTQQVDALVNAGVGADDIFQDKLSGARADRPGLQELLKHARKGDTVTVVALDRLGRSLIHVVTTINDLEARGIHVHSLREGVDFSKPVGRMIAGIFSTLAEYERELILERAAAARAAARAHGRRVGRKPALSGDQETIARQMHKSGMAITTIASNLKVSRATIYRCIERDAELLAA